MRYFLYARRSSEDKKKQIQSIPDQIRVLKELATQRNFEIVDIITDERTARLPGRLGFNALMQRLAAGEAEGILCWKIDRLSRNSLDSGVLQHTLQTGRIQQIVTPEKTHYPDDNTLLLLIECGMATQYSRDLSKNVKRGQQGKLEKRWFPGLAPLGYRNEPNGIKGQKCIFQHPELFPIIQNLWRTLLKDHCSLADLYRHMQQHSPICNRGKVISFSAFHRMFQNKFYCGLFRWGGELHIGAHAPMLTQREFEDAQSSLHSGKGVRTRTLHFDFKGLLRCGLCDSLVTAESHTKIIKKTKEQKTFMYYRCGHRKRNQPCREAAISEKQLIDQVLFEIDSTVLPDEILRFGLQTLDEMQNTAQESSGEQHLQKEIAALEKRIVSMRNNMAEESDGEIRTTIKARMTELQIQQRSLEEDLARAIQERKQPHGEIRSSLELLINAKKSFLTGTTEQKRAIVRGLGLNWGLMGRKLHYEPNFVSLAMRKTREKHKAELARFEPKENGSGTERMIPRDVVGCIWSGLLNSITTMMLPARSLCL